MAGAGQCACVAEDPFDCVARRYGRDLEPGEEGCECACHYDSEEDEDGEA